MQLDTDAGPQKGLPTNANDLGVFIPIPVIAITLIAIGVLVALVAGYECGRNASWEQHEKKATRSYSLQKRLEERSFKFVTEIEGEKVSHFILCPCGKRIEYEYEGGAPPYYQSHAPPTTSDSKP